MLNYFKIITMRRSSILNESFINYVEIYSLKFFKIPFTLNFRVTLPKLTALKFFNFRKNFHIQRELILII